MLGFVPIYTQPIDVPLPEILALRQFYGVESDAGLIEAQQRHVHALQFKLRWFAPSFAYAPPTPLEKTP
jgi:hypothetical protein